MAQEPYKVPGVYVNELNGLPNSISPVPTAVPVFIGYTETASSGTQNLTNIAVPISSMAEYLTIFGSSAAGYNNGAPLPLFIYVSAASGTPPYQADPANPRFNLYYSLQLFFMNGGGSCYVMSIGSYAGVGAAGGAAAADYAGVFQKLSEYPEPTLIVMPDAMLLDAADWAGVSLLALQHCAAMQNRIAIFDVFNGYLASDGSANDPIRGHDGSGGFYAIDGLGEAFNQYGVAYFPWLNTNVVAPNLIDYTWLSAASLPVLVADLTAEAPSLFPASAVKLQQYTSELLGNMRSPVVKPLPGDPSGRNNVANIHRSVYTLSPLYRQTVDNIAASVNLLPPSGAMAGVYARNDNTFGVFHAPANTTIISAISPAVAISDLQQESLNAPPNGIAVNALRTFPDSGLLVWGARTMAGNSDNWRYISVRRTMIMLEQSIKAGLQPYLFQANDNATWGAITSAINNFLNAMWKAGALVGATPSDAYSVAVGLGSPMSGEDLQQGILRVSVKVAVIHPAEFIVLTFQQQMQTS